MAEIICVIGNKGGTGKTTLSHMLCQGLGLLGQRAACVLTDTSREPLIPAGRRYGGLLAVRRCSTWYIGGHGRGCGRRSASGHTGCRPVDGLGYILR